MRGLFLTAGMSGYSFVAASFIYVIAISFFAGCVSDSEELLIPSACATPGVGIWVKTFAPRLVFDTLVETCNTERLTRLTLPLAGGGMTDCAGFSEGRLPLGFFAICGLDGTFAGAFYVAFLPFIVTLIFSALSSSSLELVVKLSLELDGVTAFSITAFADFLSFSAFARLSSSFSFTIAAFTASISSPLEIAGERALDDIEALPFFNVRFTCKGRFPVWRSASPRSELANIDFPSTASTLA